MQALRRLAPLVLVASLAVPIASAKTLTVQPGDTLWSIAKAAATDVATIKSLNDLTGDSIRPGQVLSVPGEESAPVEAVAPLTVTVQAGDTLYDIAVAYAISVADLIAFNDLGGTVIHPGQELQLNAGAQPPAPLVVTIKKGDSLWAIAQAYNVPLETLSAINGITGGTVLQPGHQVTVPGRYAADATDLGGAVPETITVQPGDSLWGLARSHNTTVAAILGANDLKSDRVIVGQQLRILPGAEVTAGRATTAPSISVDRGAMLWPIYGAITSRYGYRQLWISGSNFHSGLDIDGETGDPIRAAVGGKVNFAGWQGGYGYLVVVEDGLTEYYYAHASELLVIEGQWVEAGEIIARIGSTGNSTGSHLHFEIRVDGDPVDPLPILELTAQN